MTTSGDEGRTELAWREIVEHYGERPVLHDDEPVDAREPEPATDEVDEPDAAATEDEIPEVERFTPPAAPPFPTPRTWQRGVAWSGVFGAPAIALVVALFSLHRHPLLGWALVLGPIGGFLYLVREMPRAPREPWDDGSRI